MWKMNLEDRLNKMEVAMGIKPDNKLPAMLRLVCVALKVNETEVKGKSRAVDVVDARSRFCYLARAGGSTLTAIASSLRPDMDHTAVMHLCLRAEDKMDVDKQETELMTVLAKVVNVKLPPKG
jgi:chromosomal replication initiation ATPase DnaA